jgi:hypothetical protein
MVCSRCPARHQYLSAPSVSACTYEKVWCLMSHGGDGGSVRSVLIDLHGAPFSSYLVISSCQLAPTRSPKCEWAGGWDNQAPVIQLEGG